VVPSHPRQIVCETLFQKTLHKNRAGGVAQGEGPEFKPQYLKKQNKTTLSLARMMKYARCPEQLELIAGQVRVDPSHPRTPCPNQFFTMNTLDVMALITPVIRNVHNQCLGCVLSFSLSFVLLH
jgi:hypothetical protein